MSSGFESEEPGPLAYDHVFIPGSDADTTSFVLLHGSNGGERDLLDVAAGVRPGAARLGVRGDVSMEPGYSFFRRHLDRRVDEADLRARTPRLARFIEDARGRYGLTTRPLAIGYSNGAIAAMALLLTAPDVLAGAILLRPLSPFSSRIERVLNGTPVLVIDGAHDRRRAPHDGPRAADALRRAGATVRHHTLPIGHGLEEADVRIARAWVSQIELDGRATTVDRAPPPAQTD